MDESAEVEKLLQAAESERTESNYATAENKLFQALSISVHKTGATSSVSGKVCSRIGNFYMDSGNYGSAENYFLRALLINTAYSGACFNSEGEFLRIRNSASELLKNLNQLPGSIEIAKNLNSLAVLYMKQNRLGEAEQYLKKVLQIYQSSGANPGNLLNYSPAIGRLQVEAQKNLATTQIGEGKVLEAENNLKEVVEILRREKGTSPELAEALGLLGKFYKSQNRGAEAAAAEAESSELQNCLK